MPVQQYPNAVRADVRPRTCGTIDPRLAGPNPASITDLLAWWQASSIAQADGTTVATWPNLSSAGTSYDLTQATAGSRPTLRKGTPWTYLDFNGGQSLVGASRILPLTEFSLFVAMSPSTGNGGRTFGWELSGSGANGLALFQSNQDYWVYRNAGVSNDITGLGTVQGGKYVYGLLAGASGGTQAYINGVQKGTNAATGFSDAGALMHVGSSGDGSLQAKVQVAEIVIYSRKLSTAERQTVENYLNGQYSIY